MPYTIEFFLFLEIVKNKDPIYIFQQWMKRTTQLSHRWQSKVMCVPNFILMGFKRDILQVRYKKKN